MIGDNSLLQLLIRRRRGIDAYVKEREDALVEEIRRIGVVAKPRRPVAIITGLPLAFVQMVREEFQSHHASTLMDMMHIHVVRMEEGKMAGECVVSDRDFGVSGGAKGNRSVHTSDWADFPC